MLWHYSCDAQIQRMAHIIAQLQLWLQEKYTVCKDLACN